MKINDIIEEVLPELQKYFDSNYHDLRTEIIRFESLLKNLHSEESRLLEDNKRAWDDKVLPIKSARGQVKILTFLLAVRKIIWSTSQISADELRKTVAASVVVSEKKTVSPLNTFYISENHPVLIVLVIKFILEYSSSNFNTLINHARILLFQEHLHLPKRQDVIFLGPLSQLIFAGIIKLYEDAFEQSSQYFHLSILNHLPGKLLFPLLLAYYLLSDQVSLKKPLDIKLENLEYKDIEDYQSKLTPIAAAKDFFEELWGVLLHINKQGKLFACLNSQVEEGPSQLFLKNLLNLSQHDEEKQISESHIFAFREIQLQEWLIPRWLSFVSQAYSTPINVLDLFEELRFAIKSTPRIQFDHLECYINYIKYVCFLISLKQVIFWNAKKNPQCHPLHATFKAYSNLDSNKAFRVSMLKNLFQYPTIAPYKEHCYQPYASLFIKADTFALVNSWRKRFDQSCSSSSSLSSSSSSSAVNSLNSLSPGGGWGEG